MVSMGNERDVDVAYIGDSRLDDAIVVQIDSGERTKRLRIMLNEAVVYDGDPEVEKPGDAREEWAAMDVGVLGAPGFRIQPSQDDAHRASRNQGSEDDPIYYAVPVKRSVRLIDAVEYASAWRIYPTEEQLRLMPGWQKSVGEERR